MESQSLAVITSDLRKQWNIANEKAAALRTELGAIEEEANRIDAALAALSGSPPKAAGNGSKAKESKRATQTPSTKKADVIAAMRRVLEKATVMDATSLKEQVEAVLTADGFNRFGFAMRWKEALKDPQFVDTPQGMKLLHGPAIATLQSASTELPISPAEYISNELKQF